MYNMGEPRIKIVAMPKDTNPSGNIFGGWIMSQIDIAGALATRDLNVGRVVTVAVNSMEFREAVKVGDVLSRAFSRWKSKMITRHKCYHHLRSCRRAWTQTFDSVYGQ